MYFLKIYSMYYTLRSNINVKKMPWDKISDTKNPLLYLTRAPTHYSFNFNSRFLYKLRDKIRPSKDVCGIFHFRFRFVFIKVCFCSTKSMDSLTVKRHNSFQNSNNRKATHSCSQTSKF